MPPTASDAGREYSYAWPLVACGVIIVCLLAAIALVPPGTLPYAPTSLYSDAELSHWPNAYFLREAVWSHQQWPLWNPTRMLGQPFAANPLNKVWYPPQWLTLILPTTIHLDILIYLHLGWLILGIVAWARAERLHPLAGALAGFAWALNPKLVAHLGAGHLDILYALAWTPWLFWALHWLREQPTARNAVLSGSIAALLVLADLRVAFYILPAGMISALVDRPGESRGYSAQQAWWVGLLALIIAVLLTTVQTLPLLALSPFLTRSLITPQQAAVYSLPPGYLLGVVFANSGGFHEWMTYLGIPIVALAILSLNYPRRRKILLWMGIFIIAVLWSLGSHGPLFMPVIKAVPVAGWFRVPSRAWFVVSLAVVFLSAYGLDQLVKRGLGRAGRMTMLAAGFAGLIWVLAAAVMDFPGTIVGAGTALAGTGLGLWLAGGGLSRHRISLRWLVAQPRIAGAILLLLVQVIPVLILDSTLLEGRRLDIADGDWIAAQLTERCSLLYSPSFNFVGAAPVLAGIPTLHGIDPFQLRRSADAIARAAGVPPAGYSITAPPLPADAVEPVLALADAKPDYDLLSALGVSYLMAEFPVDSGQVALVTVNNGEYLYQFRQPGSFACGTGPNRLVVELSDEVPPGRPSIIVNHAWAPGWWAWVDGQPAPVSPTDLGLMNISLPVQNPGIIELIYRPLPDLAGIAISGATTLALSGWWIVHRKRHRDEA